MGLAVLDVELEERREAEVTMRGAGVVVARPRVGGFVEDGVGVAGLLVGLSQLSKKSSSPFSVAFATGTVSVAPSTKIPSGYLCYT